MFKFKQWGIGLLEMNLKMKGRVQKYWATVTENSPLPMERRLLLYFLGFMAVVFFFLLRFLFIQENRFFESAVAVLLLTFPLVTVNWFIKNRDISRQLKDSSQQLEYSSKQQNETLFSNSLQLLFKENDTIAKSVGLKELVKLKQEEGIDSERINLITSSGLQIEKASLQGADLQGADLQGVDLQGADLQKANLQKANLQKANLQKANLQKAYLLEANLLGVDLLGVDLQKANLLRADLLGANLQEADLRGANLQGVNLQGADLRVANLRGADLRGANLQRAELQGAKLRGAKLQRAELQGADLRVEDLQLVFLTDSHYDKETVFPDGFDPKQHGMKKLN